LLCVPATCFRITDITREAQIGRGTFYIHYVDKHDLLDKIKDLVDKELFSVSRISTDELPDDYAHEIVLQSLLNVIYYWLQKKRSRNSRRSLKDHFKKSITGALSATNF